MDGAYTAAKLRTETHVKWADVTRMDNSSRSINVEDTRWDRLYISKRIYIKELWCRRGSGIRGTFSIQPHW